MNLLAIIIILLALITAGSIVYIAWELSSGRPVFKKRESHAADAADNTAEPEKATDNKPPE
jgi:flagellar basal body-associated protein FliL